MSKHLMARFRHLHAADENGLNFDWSRILGRSASFGAQLENGDHLLAYGYGMPQTDDHHDFGPYPRWGYMLYGPKTRHQSEPNEPDDPKIYHSFANEPGVYSELLASFMDNDDHPGHYDDQLSAMRAAEQHYMSLNRRGTTPPAQDYDINDIMDRFNRGEL